MKIKFDNEVQKMKIVYIYPSYETILFTPTGRFISILKTGGSAV